MSTSRRLITVVLLTLMLTALLVALPAPVNATPPEDVSFDLDVTYPIGTLTGSGSWDSEGVVTGTGGVEQNTLHVGRTEDGLFRTAHSIDTLSDTYGTITIRAQITQIEHVPFKSFKGTGRWVIISGTGAYENLRGEGQATIEGTVNFPIDLTLHANYDGVAHFAP